MEYDVIRNETKKWRPDIIRFHALGQSMDLLGN